MTHYGRIGAGGADVARLAALLLEQVDAMLRIARSAPPGEARHAALKRELEALYMARLRAHGCTLSDERLSELLAIDVELNAQGLAVWLDKAHPA